MKLTNKLEPTEVVPLVRLISKESFYPLEDCLKVCRGAEHLQASAILCEEVGNYAESIKLYLQFLSKELDIKQLRRELFFVSKNGRNNVTLKNLEFLEEIFVKISNICKHHPEESLV